jgi:hypothetical protein
MRGHTSSARRGSGHLVVPGVTGQVLSRAGEQRNAPGSKLGSSWGVCESALKPHSFWEGDRWGCTKVRTGLGKTDLPGVRPAKAGVFSRSESCRGNTREPRSLNSRGRETKTLKPIDKVSLGETASHRAVTKVNAEVASTGRSSEGRALFRRAKAAWIAES